MQSIIILFPNFPVLDFACFQYFLYLSQEVIKFLKWNLIMHITSKYMQTQRHEFFLSSCVFQQEKAFAL